MSSAHDYEWITYSSCDISSLYPLCNKIPDQDEIEISQCLNGDHSISAWYDGDSFDVDLNIWMDKSGNNNNGYVVNEGDLTMPPYNNHLTIAGSFSTSILFDIEINPENYTVFNLCKYIPTAAKKGRILQATVDDVTFGFLRDIGDPSIGRSGVGRSGYWLTTAASKFGDNWLFSTQQHKLYRGNFMDFTVDNFTNQVTLQTGNKLHINVDDQYGQSGFRCGEIIVSNDKLDLGEIKCIENYLQTKYGYNTPVQCLNDGREIAAWYTGESVDVSETKWWDMTGNIQNGVITGSITYGDLNGEQTILGTTSTQIVFGAYLNPRNHTIFSVAKHSSGGTRSRILQTTVDNGIFGHHIGTSGVAYEQSTWITNDIDRFGYDWVISSQQPKLYRGNLLDFTANTGSDGFNSSQNQLAINTGRLTWQISDFEFAELIVFDELLNLTEIQCIEDYLNDIYGLGYTIEPTSDPTADPTTNPTEHPTEDPTNDPTKDPTKDPTNDPTADPTKDPTHDPTNDPTNDPTAAPSLAPSTAPSMSPTTCYDGNSFNAYEQNINDTISQLRFQLDI